MSILLVLACCLAAPPAHARGRADRESRSRLAEAEALIDEKRYNDAILLLTEIVREDPERFEAAERLMDRIRAARGLFNEKLAELETALFEENDVGKALQLIEELEALDPYPNQSVRDILARARQGREQVYYLVRIEEIMDQARRELDQERYAQAAAIYLENLDIAREVFDRAGYGNIVVDAVDAATAELRTRAAAFEESSRVVEARAAALQAAPAADPGALRAATSALRAGLLAVMEEQAGVEAAGEALRVQNQRIHDSSATDRFDLHLRLLSLLVFGRGDAREEGLARALTGRWQQQWGGVRAAALRRAEAAYEQAVASYRGANYAAAQQQLDPAAALFRAALELQALWPAAAHPGEPFAGTPGSGADAARLARGVLSEFLATQVYLRALDGYRALVQARVSLGGYGGLEGVSAETLVSSQEQLSGLIDGVFRLADQWRAEVERLEQLASRNLGPSPEPARRLLADIDALRRDLERADQQILNNLLRIRGAQLEMEFQTLSRRFAQGVELQEGRDVALEPVRDELGDIVQRPVRREQFPARALAIYQEVEGRLQGLNAELTATLDRIVRNEAYLAQDPDLRTAADSLRSLAERAKALQDELAQRRERARLAALQAERYRQEGFLRVSQARSQIASRNLEAARESLARAREALDRSLEFQEDQEVRRVRDQELARLFDEINGLDLDRVITEVRALIDEARRLYGQGDYLGAQRALLRAQKRWADVRTDENPEISFWLNLVQRALSATAGRDIPFTDPLYNEMSQLLNLATRDYLEGRRLLEQQDRRAALESFRRAEDNIRRITAVFPDNRKARVLSLQILALRDPETLRTRLTQNFAEAREKRSSDPAAAYNLVEDIEQVSPNYPGLADLKRELEYDLGLKRRPDDPVDRSRAVALYGEANSLYAQRNRSLYTLALERLDEALKLYPDYAEAKALKDRINREIGGERQDILPGREQQLLTDAQRLYRQQQYLRARLLVDDLLGRAASANHPDVIDLDRRLAGAGYPSQVRGR